jgi:hypothetical protein
MISGAYGKKTMYAHRISWLIHKGPIPEGLLVRHTCDVGLCVNPAHLEIGTQADNMADMYRRGRSSSKFTDDEVRLIRVAVAERWATRPQVCRYFNAEKSTITKLISGKYHARIV